LETRQRFAPLRRCVRNILSIRRDKLAGTTKPPHLRFLKETQKDERFSGISCALLLL
jgi:hypothetical protein